ncbi:probable WRKY transcription factor 32 isoform X1 [Morus notabilis]|uniref:probable WRKY transcription factor 32 isoform X1 n=1 Tax=Morus notabilis TaxID=981085 RepID=UPI000CECEF2C|nr:probable WRKY transcription factor 32 isoform X1 [Morus notabilis]
MAEHESSEALEVENVKRNEEEDEEEEEEEEEDEVVGDEGDEERDRELRDGELQSSEPNSKDSRLETLALPSSLESLEKDQCTDVQMNCTSKRNTGAQSKEQVEVLNEENQAVSIGQDAEAPTERQLIVCGRLSDELSPTSVTQSISSAPSPTPLQKLSPLKEKDLRKTEADLKNSSSLKTLSPISVLKIPSSDGYNWRKYGQKQVKSPEGSRSYYKCTHSECYAKKIECCDHSGSVTEIVYKSQHSHDPPKKSNSAREAKASSTERISGTKVSKQPCRVPKDADPSTSAKESIHETPPFSERKRQNSINSDENGEVMVKEEHANEPETKRRLKKSHLEYSGPLLKPSKKPKFVVHAAGDVGISGDGYRWRKYGQKMVKGNPHPRNYYRCTSAGCPVRKHIETAVDNMNAVIITYKGIHDHDMPVPKKRHGLPSAPLVAAAAPASMNNTQVKKSETIQKQVSSTQWSVDNEGELTGEALDLGGEKAMESARTLLSIGFEIKPC